MIFLKKKFNSYFYWELISIIYIYIIHKDRIFVLYLLAADQEQKNPIKPSSRAGPTTTGRNPNPITCWQLISSDPHLNGSHH